MMQILSRFVCAVVLLGAITSTSFAQTILVPAGAVWKYLDNGSNQATAWRATNFNDSAWTSGFAELGYGDSTEGRPEATVISYGPSSTNKYITYYFRHTFTVPAATVFTNLLLGVLRDDGVVVYLNGEEVWRNNMPAGTISFTTPASTNVSGNGEATYYQTNLSPSKINPGTNTFAVEVHQNSASSTDLSFDLYLVGLTATQAVSQLVFYVATNGNDTWTGTAPQPSGTADGPFATIERGRNLIRSYNLTGFLPPGGAVVEVLGGVYPLARPFELSAADTGGPQKPIVYRARDGEEVRLLAGRRLSGFTLTTDPSILAKLAPIARGRVWQADLRSQGITNFGTPQGGSTWAQSDPGLEFFFQDRPMTLARWPNKGYIKMVDVLGPTPVNVRGTIGCVEGIFSYAEERPNRWSGESDVMVHGFWFWDWADQRHKVLAIDPTNQIMTLAQPYHTYGYRKGQWFYAYNLLPELDQPEEWYLDRQTGILYFWPPAPLDQGNTMVSLLPSVVTLTNASHITLRGFTLEGAQGTALSVSGGSTNCLQACTVRNSGKTGIRISNSPGSGVTGCDIYFLGDGGINLSGGDRTTLTPAGMYADHNHIHHWSRWNPVYKQGVYLGGVGNRASHNLIHDAPHEAIGFGGNDQLIEFNEIHSVVKESNDAGVMYAGRTWTSRGHIIRYNYMHHIYGFERKGCNGVYLDDQFSSAFVYGNLFYEMPTAILIGGGRDNYVQNNVFVNCRRAIAIDARGLGWASNTIVTLTNDLNSWPTQIPPWSTRYPQLTNIMNEDPMAPRGNVVSENISWNGGWTSIESRALSGVTVTNNLLNTDPLFVDTNRLNFQLRDGSPALALGFQRIPLEQIGPDPSVPHAPWSPSVTLVQPVDGGTYGSNPGIPIEVLLSDPAKVAQGVELVVGSAVLQGLGVFPYRFTWNDAPAGEYALSALAWSSNSIVSTLSPVVVQVKEMLVATGSVWKFLDIGTNLGTVWRTTNFNDSAWPEGRAELGYGDDVDGRPEATVLHYGTNSNNKYITYYFRRAFTVRDPSTYTNLLLSVLRDDGVVVYLNGIEIWRNNMTNGTIAYTTLALTNVGGTAETTFYQTSLNPSYIHAGTNVFAVEIHQGSANSTDIGFDLSFTALAAPALPAVEIKRNSAQVTLSWPLAVSDYALESSPVLPGTFWQTDNAGLCITNARIWTTRPSSTGARFYRLTQAQP